MLWKMQNAKCKRFYTHDVIITQINFDTSRTADFSFCWTHHRRHVDLQAIFVFITFCFGCVPP